MRYYSHHRNDQFENVRIVLGDGSRNTPHNPTEIRARNYRYRAHQAQIRAPQAAAAVGGAVGSQYTMAGTSSATDPGGSDRIFDVSILKIPEEDGDDVEQDLECHSISFVPVTRN